jgi:CheY-like chemotaxis protein
VQISKAMAGDFSGKLFALIGFEPAEIAQLSSALKEVGASGRTLDPEQIVSEPDLLRAFDVCSLKPPAVNGKAALEVALSSLPVLALGTWRDLMQGTLKVANNRDFLLEPWQPEDFLLRSLQLMRGQNGTRMDNRGEVGARNPTVVVVDDDATTTTMVSSLLCNEGMQCSVAHDGSAGAKMVRQLIPRAVLLDINMPELNGFEVLTSIRNHPTTASIATMMLTSRQQEMDVIRGFALGANDYVAKPFNPLELVARVRRLTAC